MRPSVSPQEAGQNYQSGTSAKSGNYKKGVQRVVENPAAKAAANIDKMKRNLIAAIDSGKVVRGLNRTTLQSWQAAAAGKGASNYVTGTAAAVPKYVAYRAAVQPHVDQLRQEINAMPSASDADMEARQVAWSRGMKQIAANRQ